MKLLNYFYSALFNHITKKQRRFFQFSKSNPLHQKPDKRAFRPGSTAFKTLSPKTEPHSFSGFLAKTLLLKIKLNCFSNFAVKTSSLKTKLNFKLFSAVILSFHLTPSFIQAKKPIENIDFIYLYVALPLKYRLPENLRDKDLIFTGNYQKYTKALHRKDRNDILFTPTRTGNSVLVIKDSKKQILTRLVLSIQKDNLHKIAAELRELLISVDGIEFKIYNNKVIIDGQVLLPREMDRVQKIVADYGPSVKSYVSYSPLAQQKIAKLIEDEIQYPQLYIRYAYNRFLLEGCVNNPEEKKRALSIANLYTQYEVNPIGKGAVQKGLPILQDNIKVPCDNLKDTKEKEKKKESIKKLIQIVVHFVEMNKSFEKSFLFQWTPAIGDQGTQITGSIGSQPGLGSSITGVLTATISNFFPKLNWAKKFSFARVLHNSSLLMENGVTGKISTNTTVPNQTNQNGVVISGGTTAQVTINVTPKIIGPEENKLQINTGISVASPADQGVTNRTIETTINVKDGTSAVIGGLTSSFLVRRYNDNPTSVNALPILDLHSSKNYTAKKTQFIVFITPAIKSEAHFGVDRIKDKFKLDEI